jgi:hypothetical protein
MQIPDDIHVYGDKNFRGMCPEEKHEIASFFQELRLRYPDLAKTACHVRNEGKRTRWEAYKHKKEGMVPGIADIVIGGIPTAFIELKRRDHTQSKLPTGQIECLRAAKSQGCFVAIALGAEAAMRAVERWMALSKKVENVLAQNGLTKENGYGSREKREQTKVADFSRSLNR